MKSSKSAVDFEHPAKGPSRCINCVHFISPNACELVSGSIEPADWCKLFVERQVKLSEGQKYFTDSEGRVRPVFEGGEERHPTPSEEWKSGLSDDQRQAVHLWTGGKWGLIKDAAKGGGSKVNYDLLHNFNEAIDKAPQAEGKIYRGMFRVSDDAFDQITHSKSMTATSPLSFTKSQKTAKRWGGYNDVHEPNNSVVFVAESHNGADISPIAIDSSQGDGSRPIETMWQDPREQEAVVPRGSTYTVKSVRVSKSPFGGRRALVNIGWTPKAEPSKVEMAEQHFFTDNEGHIHPISGGDSNGRMNEFMERGQDVWQDKVRGGAKNRLVTDIAARMEKDPEVVQAAETISNSTNPNFAYHSGARSMYDHANTMVRGWAAMAGDNSSPLPVAHAMMTAKEFGLDSKPLTSDPDTLRRANDLMKADGGAYERLYRGFLRAEYGNTQDQLKDAGIDHVTLTRGMTWNPSNKVPNWVTSLKSKEAGASNIYANASDEKRRESMKLPLQPVTSWTANPKAAAPLGAASVPKGYYEGQMGNSYFVNLKTDVPRERILSTARTGRGALPEYEVTVLGGPTDVKAVRLDHAKKNQFGITATYPSGESDKVMFSNEHFFTDAQGKIHPIGEDRSNRSPKTGIGSWQESLTSQQKKALKYWGSSTDVIKNDILGKGLRNDDANHDLLAKNYLASGSDLEDIRSPAVTRAFEDALNTAPNYGGTIQRAVRNLTPEQFDKVINAKRLTAVVPVSFTSNDMTSVSEPLRFRFLEHGDNNTGTVLFIADKHNGGDISSSSIWHDENEVVVPRGSTYKVTRVEHPWNTPNGIPGEKYAEVHIEYEPNGEKSEVRMASAPTGFFKDSEGKTHPLFTSPGGQRQPMASRTAWHQSLTSDQEKALKDWTQEGFTPMKDVARGKFSEGSWPTELDDEHRDEGSWSKELHDFNMAIHTAPGHGNNHIYRGIDMQSSEAFDNLVNARTIKSRSPVSFAGYKDTAEAFVGGSDNGIVLETTHHNAADISDIESHQNEHEFVVPQGSTYKVDSVRMENLPHYLKGARGQRRLAYVKISLVKPTEEKDLVELADSPTGFYKDSHGKVHPIFQSAVRNPTSDSDTWEATLNKGQVRAVRRWVWGGYDPSAGSKDWLGMKSAARGNNNDETDKRDLSLFNQAVHTAPDANGRIGRLIVALRPDAFDRLTSAKTLLAKAPSSFSKTYVTRDMPIDLRTSDDIPSPIGHGTSGTVKLVSDNHNAGDITKYSPAESEAVVPQGSVYHVDRADISPDRRGATLHISYIGGKPEEHPIEMATEGSPTGFFRDKDGNVHPIFTSQGGIRHPMEKADWIKSLSPEEERSIKLWTASSTPIKTVATDSYGDEKLTNDWKGELDTFNRAVDRAPTHNGDIFRGIHSLSDDAFNTITSAKSLAARSPASFSGSRKDVTAFTDKNGLYASNGSHSVMFISKNGAHNGAHIRPAQDVTDENEVIVPQGSVYHVDKVQVKENTRGGKLARVYISHAPGSSSADSVKLSEDNR